MGTMIVAVVLFVLSVRTTAHAGSSLVGSAISILLPPRFTCGPHLTTYLVEGPSSTQGDGVRCVKFGRSGTISWYGEG